MRLAFVDAPEVTAVVRLDLHDIERGIFVESLDLGVPPLLGDPGSVGSEYDYRRPELGVWVKGSRAAASALQARLAAEVLRDENYLLFQIDAASEPMWLRTYRTSPGGIGLRPVQRDGEAHWLISVPLVAEPFALGAQETLPLAIGNNPATGGLVAEIANVKGDAPAPLVVDLVGAEATSYIQPWLSMMPLDATADASWPVVWQCEALTLSNGAVVDPSNADVVMVNMGRNAGEVALQRKVTAQATVPFAGRWRLFLRAIYTDTEASHYATIRGSGDAAIRPLTTTQLPDRGGYSLVDLGEYAFPRGNMPTSKPYTLAPVEIGVDVGVVAPMSTPGTVRLDYIVAVPVDLPLDSHDWGTVLNFRQQTQTRGNVVLRLDGEAEAVHELVNGTYGFAAPESPAGSFLRATPGARNVLTLLPRRSTMRKANPLSTGAGVLASDDVKTQTTNLTIHYRPRHLYLPSG